MSSISTFEKIKTSVQLLDPVSESAVGTSVQLLNQPHEEEIDIEAMKKFAATYSHCLLYFQQNEQKCNFFHPIYKYRYVMEKPELSGAVIRSAQHGWLLFSQGKYSLFFFNPFTNARIQLPDSPNSPEEDWPYNCVGITFTHPPTSSNCMVFGLWGYKYGHVLVRTIRHGETSWTVQYYENNQKFHPSYSNPVFCYKDKLFYCLDIEGKVGVFNPQKRKNPWTVLATPARPDKLVFQNFLIESNGAILSVSLALVGRWVEVFKLDRNKMIWRRVKNLGNRILLVSHRSSFSVKTDISGIKNKICFPRFQGRDTTFYSLETGKHHTFGSDYCTDDLNNTKEHVHNTWLELKVDDAHPHPWCKS